MNILVRTFGYAIAVQLLLIPLAVGRCVSPQEASAGKQEEKRAPIYTVAKYNPERDAADDLAETITQAKKSGKRIILEIGGDW